MVLTVAIAVVLVCGPVFGQRGYIAMVPCQGSIQGQALQSDPVVKNAVLYTIPVTIMTT